jgi:hypothetical protein
MNWRGSCLTKGVRQTGTGLLALAAVALCGCGGHATADKASALNGDRIYAVSSDAAAFYRYGPQQGNGPDRTLARDTLVRLIRPSFGYCKVQVMEDKQQGYVAADDLRVAPANLVAAANATPPPIASTSSPAAEQFDVNDPRLNATQEQLPPPDLPPATETPPPDAAPTP